MFGRDWSVAVCHTVPCGVVVGMGGQRPAVSPACSLRGKRPAIRSCPSEAMVFIGNICLLCTARGIAGQGRMGGFRRALGRVAPSPFAGWRCCKPAGPPSRGRVGCGWRKMAARPASTTCSSPGRRGFRDVPVPCAWAAAWGPASSRHHWAFSWPRAGWRCWIHWAEVVGHHLTLAEHALGTPHRHKGTSDAARGRSALRLDRLLVQGGGRAGRGGDRGNRLASRSGNARPV